MTAAILQKLTFCCPQCKGLLEKPDAAAYHCPACPRTYPIVLDIPDFRVYPDPYIDYADDHAKAARVVREAGNRDFAGMVAFYWSITPGIPDDMVKKFIWHAVSGVDRGRGQLREFETLRRQKGDVKANVFASADSLLEVGCGTGGFLVAAAPHFRQIIGTDIAMRWLVIARKRFEEQGIEMPLVCCCADYLPFPDGTFNAVTAFSVIEHVADQSRMVSEGARTLKTGGALFLTTPNRLTLGPEPHVQVWGVGLLPRRLMAPYVRAVRGIPYKFIRVLSGAELGAMLHRVPLESVRVYAPAIEEEEAKTLGPKARRLIPLYNRLQRTPLFQFLLRLFGPRLNGIGFRSAAHSADTKSGKAKEIIS